MAANPDLEASAAPGGRAVRVAMASSARPPRVRRRIIAEFVDELLPHLPRPPANLGADERRLWRLLQRLSVTQRVVRAVEHCLRLSPPSVVELWDEALPEIHRSIPASTNGRYYPQPREKAMRNLPDDVLRALLVAHHPRYRDRVTNVDRVAFQELIFPTLDNWESQLGYERELYDEMEAAGWEGYPGRNQPASDADETDWERHEGARQKDWERHEVVLSDAVSGADENAFIDVHAEKYGGDGGGFIPPRTRNSLESGVDERFRALAQEKGVRDLDAFAAKAKRGKPTARESERLRQLGRIAKQLHEEGYTLAAIGEVLDGRSEQRVHDQIALADGRSAKRARRRDR